MLFFASDYMEGAHEAILRRLSETNLEKTTGYGTDSYSLLAAEKIRKACGCDELEVYFTMGGTQTNALLIASLLRPFEGVISAKSGHIATHEAGAIEQAGRKVLELPHREGLLDAADIEDTAKAYREDPNRDHMVRPGMVYVSHPSEYGTLYSREQLLAIRKVCDQYGLYLYLDGARLGYGLASDKNDVSLPDLALLTDAFYIGGTKCGALFGEALVVKKGLISGFVSLIKQKGALLAKGRIAGLQFDTLFTEELYTNICKSAVVLAEEIKKDLIKKGYRLFVDSPTNQQFFILPKDRIKALSQKVAFGYMEPYDEHHSVIRFCTSWATAREDVEALLKLL